MSEEKKKFEDPKEDDPKGVEKIFTYYGTEEEKWDPFDDTLQEQLQVVGKIGTLKSLKRLVTKRIALDPGLHTWLEERYLKKIEPTPVDDIKLERELKKLLAKGETEPVKKWIADKKPSLNPFLVGIFQYFVLKDEKTVSHEEKVSLRCLLEACPEVLNTLDSVGETALFWVLRRGDGKGATFLISKKAKLDVVSSSGETLFHAGAESGCIDPMLKGVKEAGWTSGKVEEYLNKKGGELQQTPLHISCTQGDAPAIETLAKAGAKVDVLDINGNTPLHKCILNEKKEAAEALKAFKPDPTISNKEGKTPVALAKALESPLLVVVSQIALIKKGAHNGILEIGLQWFDIDDCALMAVTPSGERICWTHMVGACGGRLDVDENAGGGRTKDANEHIFWKTSPPEGTYRVEILLYASRSKMPLPFELTVYQTHGDKQTVYAYMKGQQIRQTTLQTDGLLVCSFKWENSQIKSFTVGPGIHRQM